MAIEVGPPSHWGGRAQVDWYEARTSLSDKGIKPLMFGGARCQPHPQSLPAIRET